MLTDTRFQEVIASVEQLRGITGSPNFRVVNKEVSALDTHARAFIAASPFVLVATCDAQGRMDISPKGDPPGFVQVLDDQTLAIPDRPGNRRADTFTNLLENPRVGLFFMIPGKQETLRVSGHAKIVRDGWLRESMAINGKVPDLALVVTVEQLFFHCQKCIIRSHLWEPDTWPDGTGLPTLAEAMVSHGRLTESVTEMQVLIEESLTTRLY
jgi:uncharacterized protein